MLGNQSCRTFLAVFAAALLAIACLAAPVPAAAKQASSAQFRVLHTVFDAPGIDIYLNGSKAITDLEYKGVTPRTSLDAGTYTVKITRTGESDSIFSTELNLEAGKNYTLVVVGKLANVSAKLLEDDLSKLDAGKVRVRLMHTSPDTPAIDVALQNGKILVPNLGFAEFSDYLTVDAATITVELRPAGSTTVALTVPNVELVAGTVYTVVVVGTSSGAPGLAPVVLSDKVQVAEALPATGGPGGASSSPPDTVPTTGAGTDPLEVFSLAALLAMALIASGSILRKLSSK